MKSGSLKSFMICPNSPEYHFPFFAFGGLSEEEEEEEKDDEEEDEEEEDEDGCFTGDVSAIS